MDDIVLKTETLIDEHDEDGKVMSNIDNDMYSDKRQSQSNIFSHGSTVQAGNLTTNNCMCDIDVENELVVDEDEKAEVRSESQATNTDSYSDFEASGSVLTSAVEASKPLNNEDICQSDLSSGQEPPSVEKGPIAVPPVEIILNEKIASINSFSVNNVSINSDISDNTLNSYALNNQPGSMDIEQDLVKSYSENSIEKVTGSNSLLSASNQSVIPCISQPLLNDTITVQPIHCKETFSVVNKRKIDEAYHIYCCQSRILNSSVNAASQKLQAADLNNSGHSSDKNRNKRINDIQQNPFPENSVETKCIGNWQKLQAVGIDDCSCSSSGLTCDKNKNGRINDIQQSHYPVNGLKTKCIGKWKKKKKESHMNFEVYGRQKLSEKLRYTFHQIRTILPSNANKNGYDCKECNKTLVTYNYQRLPMYWCKECLFSSVCDNAFMMHYQYSKFHQKSSNVVKKTGFPSIKEKKLEFTLGCRCRLFLTNSPMEMADHLATCDAGNQTCLIIEDLYSVACFFNYAVSKNAEELSSYTRLNPKIKEKCSLDVAKRVLKQLTPKILSIPTEVSLSPAAIDTKKRNFVSNHSISKRIQNSESASIQVESELHNEEKVLQVSETDSVIGPCSIAKNVAATTQTNTALGSSMVASQIAQKAASTSFQTLASRFSLVSSGEGQSSTSTYQNSAANISLPFINKDQNKTANVTLSSSTISQNNRAAVILLPGKGPQGQDYLLFPTVTTPNTTNDVTSILTPPPKSQTFTVQNTAFGTVFSPLTSLSHEKVPTSVQSAQNKTQHTVKMFKKSKTSASDFTPYPFARTSASVKRVFTIPVVPTMGPSTKLPNLAPTAKRYTPLLQNSAPSVCSVCTVYPSTKSQNSASKVSSASLSTETQNSTLSNAQNSTLSNAQNSTQSDAQNSTQSDAQNSNQFDAQNSTQANTQNSTQIVTQYSNPRVSTVEMSSIKTEKLSPIVSSQLSSADPEKSTLRKSTLVSSAVTQNLSCKVSTLPFSSKDQNTAQNICTVKSPSKTEKSQRISTVQSRVQKWDPKVNHPTKTSCKISTVKSRAKVQKSGPIICTVYPPTRYTNSALRVSTISYSTKPTMSWDTVPIITPVSVEVVQDIASTRSESLASRRLESTASTRSESTLSTRTSESITSTKCESIAPTGYESTASTRSESTASTRSESTESLWYESTASIKSESTAPTRTGSTASTWSESIASTRSESTASTWSESIASTRTESTSTRTESIASTRSDSSASTRSENTLSTVSESIASTRTESIPSRSFESTASTSSPFPLALFPNVATSQNKGNGQISNWRNKSLNTASNFAPYPVIVSNNSTFSIPTVTSTTGQKKIRNPPTKQKITVNLAAADGNGLDAFGVHHFTSNDSNIKRLKRKIEEHDWKLDEILCTRNKRRKEALEKCFKISGEELSDNSFSDSTHCTKSQVEAEKISVSAQDQMQKVVSAHLISKGDYCAKTFTSTIEKELSQSHDTEVKVELLDTEYFQTETCQPEVVIENVDGTDYCQLYNDNKGKSISHTEYCSSSEEHLLVQSRIKEECVPIEKSSAIFENISRESSKPLNTCSGLIYSSETESCPSDDDICQSCYDICPSDDDICQSDNNICQSVKDICHSDTIANADSTLPVKKIPFGKGFQEVRRSNTEVLKVSSEQSSSLVKNQLLQLNDVKGVYKMQISNGSETSAQLSDTKQQQSMQDIYVVKVKQEPSDETEKDVQQKLEPLNITVSTVVQVKEETPMDTDKHVQQMSEPLNINLSPVVQVKEETPMDTDEHEQQMPEPLNIDLPDKCVTKEWIFKSIIQGQILKDVHAAIEIIHDNDEQSTIAEFQEFEQENHIHMQTSGSSSGKSLLKRQNCVY
ncbi:uncharacterized protein LOC127709460 [Mytilus californianus]|uniref:uncharacterized protein LOC127709460 n=1 Tax=Mytilus californianus TaxID=6549 RepID=UPI002248432F|nr:uncharacterized protein LOC127709460 [Mytilus californianus]XP_052071002.1 uncharacterized protein LOC127709460 [Mytilus californianus]